MNTETIKPEIEIDREESNALIAVEKINALEVFNGGMLPIIEEIHKKVAVLVPDVTTAKGRKEIASMANKIARSKTLLDDVGKNLVADWKAKAKIVDDNRKLMRDKLDALKEATRAPLTAWEQKEQIRIEKYENGLKELIELQTIEHGATVVQINAVINKLDSYSLGDDWEDLKERATAAHSYAMKNAVSRLEERKNYDAQQIEIQRLREQEAMRAKEEQARADLELKQTRERMAKEFEDKKRAAIAEEERIEAELNAKRAIERAEAEKQAAIEAQKRAEERARVAEENAKREAELAILREKEVAEKAKREEEYRLKKEQEKISADKATAEIEAKRKAAAIAKREKNVTEAEKAIESICSNEETGKSQQELIIQAIMAGEVPHVQWVD